MSGSQSNSSDPQNSDKPPEGWYEILSQRQDTPPVMRVTLKSNGRQRQYYFDLEESRVIDGLMCEAGPKLRDATVEYDRHRMAADILAKFERGELVDAGALQATVDHQMKRHGVKPTPEPMPPVEETTPAIRVDDLLNDKPAPKKGRKKGVDHSKLAEQLLDAPYRKAIENVEAQLSLLLLEALETAEKAGKNRKTVLAAIEDRSAAMKASNPVKAGVEKLQAHFSM